MLGHGRLETKCNELQKGSATKGISKNKSKENESLSGGTDKDVSAKMKELGLGALREIVKIMDEPGAFKEKIIDTEGAVIVAWLDVQYFFVALDLHLIPFQIPLHKSHESTTICFSFFHSMSRE